MLKVVLKHITLNLLSPAYYYSYNFRQIDHLAKQIIHMYIKEGDIPDRDISVFSQLEKTIGNIEMNLDKIHHLENENR